MPKFSSDLRDLSNSRIWNGSIENARARSKWRRILIAGGFDIFLAACVQGDAFASTCAPYTYTFANGTTADATQVNANFAAILNCANTYLAPLASPQFSGSVGIGIAPTHTLDVGGNGTVSGYVSVGSNSTPANTTSGDLTADRLSVGNQALSSFGAEGVLVSNTEVDTSGDITSVMVAPSLSPASSSSAGFFALQAQNVLNTASSFTGTGADGLAGGYFRNSVSDSGAINTANGIQAFGLLAGSGATALGAVTNVNGIYVGPLSSFSNGLNATITNAVGIQVANSINSGTGPLSITNQAGVVVNAISGATNNSGIVLGQGTIPSGNFGIYDASTFASYFAGSVGIGTSSPVAPLSVSATSVSSNNPIASFVRSGGLTDILYQRD